MPIDYFVQAFHALMTEARDGDFFHIASDTPTSISNVIEYGEKFLHISGLRAGRPEEFTESPKNSLERLFTHYMETYGPYMKDQRVFATERSRPILQRRGIVCPRFDETIFTRCMQYALAVEWGAKLFA